MSQVQQIKEASDIIQLIGERLSLQRSGSNFRGLCPFHSEKSPSFFVNEQFQRYTCFGCGEKGDVFTFLEKYEGMTFGEALKYLADRAGITLEQQSPDPAETERIRLLGLLDLAKEYYHYLLTQHEVGEPARVYLKERGVTQESIKVFRLGYAMSAWDSLIHYLHTKKKYEVRDVIAAGLAIQGKNNRPYDRFRNRLMFPLANHRGQIVGFSGRLLDNQAKEAKYINTPETLLYHKSQMLFGLSELYQPIRQKREVVVVEGEFDVISSAQAHVNNVVAIKGSALTTEHARLLSRVADRALLSLDMDAAGVEATKRAIAVAKNTNLELRVIQIPNGKDPDELARQDPAAWRQAVKNTSSVYDFFLTAAVRRFDPAQPEGKRQIMEELAPILAEIPLVVEQEVYIKKLAELLDTSATAVKTDIDRIVARAKAKSALPSQRSMDHAKPTANPLVTVSALEKYVLFLLLRSTPAQFITRVHQLKPQWFDQAAAKALIKAGQLLQKPIAPPEVIRTLDNDLQQHLFDFYIDPELTQLLLEVDSEKEWPMRLAGFKIKATQGELVELTEKLRTLESQSSLTPTEQAEYEALIAQVAVLQKQQRGA